MHSIVELETVQESSEFGVRTDDSSLQRVSLTEVHISRGRKECGQLGAPTAQHTRKIMPESTAPRTNVCAQPCCFRP